MARNVERKLVQAGTLKDPILNRKSNIQGIYLKERFQYSNGKSVSNLMPKGVSGPSWDGKNEKAGEVRKGAMRGVRNLSYQELMERRAKGLCFKCGQNYSPMHRYLEKELRLLV